MTLHEILGGIDMSIDDNTTTIEIIGGFNKYLEPQKNTMVVGNITKTFVKNKITEWKTFQDVYYKDGELELKYYDKFMDVMNIIFPLPVSTESDKDLVYMIYTIYNSNTAQIINGIEKFLNLIDPFKLTMRELFMEWKMYLEKLIEIFVELREQYIDTKLKTSEFKNTENNFSALVERWSEIDTENKIDTSSPILFFNFPPSAINLEKTIPKIEWHIKGAPDKITNTIDTFLSAVKKVKFEYIGFCPHLLITRFKLLLNFPVAELLNIIKILNTTKDFDIKQHEKIKQSEKIINEINLLKNQINLKLTTKNFNIKRHKVGKISDFPKNPNDKVKFYEKYIDAYLDLYQRLIPIFVKKEKDICEISVKINLISKDISVLTNLF
jgi:hypothetical protein